MAPRPITALAAALAVAATAAAGPAQAQTPAGARLPLTPDDVGGCGRAPATGSYLMSVSSGGIERQAVIHLPPAAPGRALPLLIALHGARQNGGFFEGYTGYSQIADGEGFIAVYPDAATYGAYPFWNINRHDASAPDDVRFVSDLIDRVEALTCVDPRRVYLTGVSNGAGMAVRAACELSTRITAVASVAGGYRSLPPCRPARALSVLEIHGTGDGAVPYGGDPATRAGSVSAFLDGWVRHDGCRTVPSRRRAGSQLVRYDWAGCRDGTAVSHLEVLGGEHQLPGAMPHDHGPIATFSAPWEVWSFLARRRTPVAGARRAVRPASRPATGHAPPRAAQASSPGCLMAPGDHPLSLAVGGLPRTALLHVPSAPGAGPVALLLALHGFRQGGADLARQTGLSAEADRHGFAVLYPDAPGGQWHPYAGQPRAEADVAFLSSALEAAAAALCGAPSPISVLGVSNGGGEAARVACELGGRVRGAVLVAGDYRSMEACHPAAAVSVLAIHGRRDPVVPYAGRPPDAHGSVAALLGRWRQLDRCGSRASRSVAGGRERLSWSCRAGARVSALRIAALGHAWPSGGAEEAWAFLHAAGAL